MTLTVILADDSDAWIARCAEQYPSHVPPPTRRTVHVTLTPEQVAHLAPRVIYEGWDNGKPYTRREKIELCFIEAKE